MNPAIKIRSFLKQPYPFYYEGKTAFYLFLLLFVMALAFNLLFEPFNVYTPEHRMSFFWISMVHSAVAGLAFVCLCIMLRPLGRIRSNWTVGNEIAWLIGFLLLTGISQFLIRDFIYDNPYNWSLHYLMEEVRNTFLVGVLFIAILVPLNFNRLYLRNQKMALQLPTYIKEESEGSGLQIDTQLKGDDFYIDTGDFILARADGNYVNIFLLEGGRVRKMLKRITIGSLEKQMRTAENIMRTHRSFIVNLAQIVKISGNAQGYKLKLRDTEESAYVSRNMIGDFELRLKK
jgi:hypothetical protein